MRKDALVCTACCVTRASLVRARAARALSEAAESRRADAHVPSVRVYCTGYGAVRGASVSSCVLLCCFVAGALRRSHTEGQQPPNPKGWTSRSRRTSHLDRPPGRPCRESPGLFVLSLAFLGVQQTVVRQSTRATSDDRAASAASSRKRVSTPHQTPALLASRPPLADLKAFSQGIADAERFETASSKFRWKPSRSSP